MSHSLLSLLIILAAAAPARAADASEAQQTEASVLVLDFAGEDRELAGLVTQLVAAELSERYEGSVLSSADLARVLALEEQRQLLGCDDQSCLAELARALGVEEIVYGEVAVLGTKTLITMSFFDARAARAKGRSIVETERREELRSIVRSGVDQLIPRAGFSPWLAGGVTMAGLGTALVVGAVGAAAVGLSVRSDAASSGASKELAGTAQIVGGMAAAVGLVAAMGGATVALISLLME